MDNKNINNNRIIDNINLSFEKSEDNDNNYLFINELNNFSITRQETWIKDDLVTNCYSCKTNFTIFNRKHHCRHCGKIFCSTCTRHKIIIPDFSKKNNKKREKVCCSCYFKISNLLQALDIYTIISNLPLDLRDIYKLSMVSKKYNKSCKYYKLTIKNLQNYCCAKKNFNNLEWNIIWCNRYIYASHSNWMILILKYVTQFKVDSTETLKVLYSQRQYPCNKLFCNLNCKKTLSLRDAIICLNLKIGFNNEATITYILDKFWSSNVSEFICYIPIFIDMITESNSELANYLISISKHNYEIANFFFWELTIRCKYNCHHKKIYESLRLQFINEIKEETKSHLQNCFYFVENLIGCYDQLEFPILLKSYISTNISNYGCEISSPINPYILIKDIDENNIQIKQSYLKPSIINFITNKNEVYRMMVKKDDLRRDQIAMNLIKIIDLILKNEEKLDLNIVTYNVLPVNRHFGFIEIVIGAQTIYSINKDCFFSISNYILEKNSNISIDEVRKRFTKSCVGYCIISYILGIGDRHLENIMIKESGEIFHIDFGFILGKDPKLFNPEIRLTEEMIDAMGGKHSKYFTLFKELCARCIIRLRRHINIIKLVLYSLIINSESGFTKEYIDGFIENKLMIDSDISEVKFYLINKLSNTSSMYTETMIDFCHNTLSKGSDNILQYAMNYGNGIFEYLKK